MMKLGIVILQLEKSKTYLNQVIQPLSFGISIFSPGISKFWYITSNFVFFLVFKDFFNKDGYNFDDISKNGYSRAS